MIQDYSKAKKLGERAYRKAVATGRYPYLPSLEQMVEDVDRYPEIPLGLAEIPLEMIVGTRTSGRQNAFAANFMPLMAENSEFAVKWSSLYDSQIEEGIRDPVKAYEFMNRFYVEEGNKRVSVLRYVGAVSIPADIIRIRPPRTDTEQSRLYYEYLDFYRVTGSFEIVLSVPGSYARLARILEQNLQDPWPEELLEKLHAGFLAFKTVYQKRGGSRLSITAGDALLIYLGIYSLDSLLREGNDEIGRRLLRLWREFIVAGSPEGIALIERSDEAELQGKKPPLLRAAKMVGKTVEKTGAAGVAGAADLAGAFAGITAGADAARATRKAVRNGLETVFPTVMSKASSVGQDLYSPSSPLRIAFLYEKDAQRSGWVYGHELGRNHLKEAFGSLVQTMRFENCRTEGEIEEAFATAAEEGCGMIFTTSPSLSRQAMRFAVEHPSVKVLNCSYNHAQHAMRFYYGKMFEAKYLMGALAASLTDDHRIGYIAGRSDLSAVPNINAFALGAQLVDPYCRIELKWLEDAAGDSRETMLDALMEKGKIHVVSDIDMIRPGEGDHKYGLYLRDDTGGLRRLAAPIWNWGVFYEILVRKMLAGTYDSVPAGQKDRALNYWLGISSGIIDIILSDDLPKPTYRLISLLRSGIVEERIRPFEGLLTASDGSVHGTADGALSNVEIIEMDWLVENVDGSL